MTPARTLTRRVGYGAVALAGALAVAAVVSADQDQPGRMLAPAQDNFAYHKKLWPLNGWDYAGIIGSGVGLLIAAGGGIGGGSIIVPLYILLLGFNPKHAIPLSNLTILGGAIANLLFNCPKRHPKADRPVIDWDMILIMEPSTIAGAVIGSFMSKFLPEVVITTLLSIVLLLMAWRTLTKGVKLWNEETEQQERAGIEMTRPAGYAPVQQTPTGTPPARGPQQQLLLGPNGVMYQVPGREGSPMLAPDDQEELEDLLEDEATTPWKKVGLIILCFLGCIALTLAKGSGSYSPIGVTCGSLPFWLVSLASIPWVIAFAAIFRCMLLDSTDDKARLNYPFVDTDIEWNEDTTVRYPMVCTIAGLFAGLFGVGGGIVKGPLMLEMGVAPAVASATAATMILFTTSAATVSFSVFGLLDWDYGGILFVLGFVCTMIGQIGLNACMKSMGRESPIVFSIGLVVLISAFLVAAGTWLGHKNETFGQMMKTESLCA